MEIRFYQAECGDAARILFLGIDGNRHNLFIDSGFAKTFRQTLKGEIQSIIQENEYIDLWVISHIHDDHIGGAISYIESIKEKELNDVVKKWVYNFPRSFLNIVKKDTSLNISQAKSISQGDTLTEYLLQTGSYLNDVTHNSSALDLFGLNIIFLSPDPSSLINLRNKYLAPFKPLDKIEQDSVSEAKGRLTNDYHIPVNDFIFKTWKEDDSIENLSSISMLIEMGNIRTLWLADASPTIVVAKLKEMGFSRDNPLECELVKVSHHGSNGNNSDELYSMIRCNSYFFSVNGENKYCLPSKECIVRILKNKQRLADQHYTLYFSYDNETLKSVFAIDSVDIYTKLNFTVHYQSDPFRTFHFD